MQSIIITNKEDLDILIHILLTNGYSVNIIADYDQYDEDLFIVRSYNVQFNNTKKVEIAL